MPLSSPNLDDRDFRQLVEEARLQIQRTCPGWTDLSPHDPGMVLLELFAHLTETMIYRLNRVPEKAYVEFLRLMGVKLHPPGAASVVLRFSRSQVSDQAVEIPRGTRATVARSTGEEEPPVFATARAARIGPGESTVEVLAYHCDLVEGELVGIGTSLPGLTVHARRPPVIAPTGDELDLLVGVEADPAALAEETPQISFEGKAYRIWREVDSFSRLGEDRHVYVVDRMAGAITFAPAARMALPDGALESAPVALAEVPEAGREIRLWYRCGGGPAGNVAAQTLTVMKDAVAGIAVTNPRPAAGGTAAEPLDNALVRGPQELHALNRAVTARDFEMVALASSRGVARARALTRAAEWAHAAPGAVEVVLVPDLPADARPDGRVTMEALQARQTDPVRDQIQRALDERRPLGTTCTVTWARYKPVRVHARIVVRREEDPTAVKRRVLRRLHDTISPLPGATGGLGWPFGQALRTSHVYEIALDEPGVLWVDQVQLAVQAVPESAVTAVASDAFQSDTWYAASGGILFRSLDDGQGWEVIGEFPGETITAVAPHPERPGVLAAAVRLPDNKGSRIFLSEDCGETWPGPGYTLALEVQGMAWVMRSGQPVLLLATSAGLYELLPGGSPLQVLVDPASQALGFFAVAASRDVRGQVSVAVAAQGTGGVYLSATGGRSGTFQNIGLKGEDVRVLAVQYDGPRAFLWAGLAAAGNTPGEGCHRWELRGAEHPPEGWRPFGEGWTGGSCRSFAFLGTTVAAGSYRAGVLRLQTNAASPKWSTPERNCGLPLRGAGEFEFEPVSSVAADPAGGQIMLASPQGVFRGTVEGKTYGRASNRDFTDRVTLPSTWLFCSGDHDVTVVNEDEAE
jgi:hypothetical protein